MSVAMTVRGELSAEKLGRVLAHEHLCCDFSLRGGNPDNRMLDWDLIAHELSFFKKAGGGTIVEVTPLGMGSDPDALRRISEASGVPIVHGISFYHEDTYPAWVWPASVEKIADFFVREIEEGHNGVRAGLLGEITSHNEDLAN
ncbi:MAG TPA: phosphotriesterase-related protein, partial [Acidobacteriota bacterium]